MFCCGHIGTPTASPRPENGIAAGGRRHSRALHRLADRRVAAEDWIIDGAGHAWSGGDAAGSYTDPTCRDASAQMVRFFMNARDVGVIAPGTVESLSTFPRGRCACRTRTRLLEGQRESAER